MVLRLVDDDMSVLERRAVEERVRLVDEKLVGRGPSPTAAGGAGQHAVDELDRSLRRPAGVDHRLEWAGLRPEVVAAGPTPQLLLRQHAQPLATLIDRHHARLGGVDPIRDQPPIERMRARPDRHAHVLGRRLDRVERRLLELDETLGRALPAGEIRFVGRGDLDLGDAQVERRALAHAALAERGQDVGDVVEEGAVGTDDQHAIAGEPAAVLEEQIGGAVQGDRGLAGARTTLHDQGLIDRRTDDDVLLGLDRGDDLAHRT